MEEKILEILKQENVDESCAQVNCEKWDSLKHLELVVEIESAFNIELEPEEIAEMKSFKDIKRILQGK